MAEIKILRHTTLWKQKLGVYNLSQLWQFLLNEECTHTKPQN